MAKPPIIFTNVPPGAPVPLPPGYSLHGVHKAKFSAGGFATITVDHDPPRSWGHELGNGTLHLSRPFLRRPVVESVQIFSTRLMMYYCIIAGLFCGMMFNWFASPLLGRPMTLTTTTIFVVNALIYTVWYRYRLRQGIAKVYRDRIMGLG